MNEKQTKYYRMSRAVQTVLDQYPEKWNHVPILVSLKNNLDEIIQRIDEQNEKTGVSSKSTTKNKDLIRTQIKRKAVILAGAVYSYAMITDNIALQEISNLSGNTVERCKETDLQNLLKPVIQAVKDNATDLANYAVTVEMATDLETSLDDFVALIGQPRVIRNKQYAAKGQIDTLISEVRILLEDKMDKLMIRFKYTDMEFYDMYQRARTIVD